MTVRRLIFSMMLILSALIYSCTLYQTRPSAESHFQHTDKKHAAIFQMIRTDGKPGTCSAFVVSDEYAFTAGHCVHMTVQDVEGSVYAKPDIFIVRNSRRQDTGVRAVAISKSYNAKRHKFDYAVLKGNFRDFRKLKVSGRLRLIKGENYYTCGYPAGKTPILCTNFLAYGPNNFEFIGQGYVMGGMSGGPVIDDYGFAVGIISSIARDIVGVQPVVGVLNFE